MRRLRCLLRVERTLIKQNGKWKQTITNQSSAAAVVVVVGHNYSAISVCTAKYPHRHRCQQCRLWHWPLSARCLHCNHWIVKTTSELWPLQRRQLQSLMGWCSVALCPAFRCAVSAVKDSGAIVEGAAAVAVHSPREWSQESVDDSFDLKNDSFTPVSCAKSFWGQRWSRKNDF